MSLAPSIASIRLAETFLSVQGEGPSLGEPAHFIRLQGCSVGCHWCDSKYTWREDGGELQTLEGLAARLDDLGRARLVVITGGEPLENEAFPALVEWVTSRWERVEVETSGNRPLPAVAPNVFWNWSPKLSSVTSNAASTWEHREDFEQNGRYICKVVVDTRDDWVELCARVEALAIPAERVVVMPQGLASEALAERARWLAPLVIERGYRLTTRLHIEVWGAKRGV